MTEEMTNMEAGAVKEIRTIETITAEIVAIRGYAQQVVLASAVEIGRRLVEAKDLLPYGEWGAWLKERVDFSQVTATRYMRLYEEYAAKQGSLFGAEVDFSTLKNLSVSKALALLVIPAEEREEFAAEHDVENLSTRQMDELMERVRAAEDDKKKAEAALAGTQLELEKTALERDDLRDQVKELDMAYERAVQDPDPKELQARVDAAVAEATKETKKTVKDLRAKLKEATERADRMAKEAESQQMAAGEAASAVAERDRLRELLQKAEKKLAMSDAAVSAVNVHFETVQTEFAKLAEGLLQIGDEETREKVRGAVLQLLDKLREKIGGGGDA